LRGKIHSLVLRKTYSRINITTNIRAGLFTKLGKELPNCCEVRIEEFKEPQPDDMKPITRRRADISVERDSQKGIVVGKDGAMIKDVGSEAREKLEEFLQEKVFLALMFG